MITAKVWQSGNSQAIRIPREYHAEQKGRSRGLTVVTHNTSAFQRVPGILMEDWVM